MQPLKNAALRAACLRSSWNNKKKVLRRAEWHALLRFAQHSTAQQNRRNQSSRRPGILWSSFCSTLTQRGIRIARPQSGLAPLRYTSPTLCGIKSGAHAKQIGQWCSMVSAAILRRLAPQICMLCCASRSVLLRSTAPQPIDAQTKDFVVVIE